MVKIKVTGPSFHDVYKRLYVDAVSDKKRKLNLSSMLSGVFVDRRGTVFR
jgi:hypothetical protein